MKKTIFEIITYEMSITFMLGNIEDLFSSYICRLQGLVYSAEENI